MFSPRDFHERPKERGREKRKRKSHLLSYQNPLLISFLKKRRKKKNISQWKLGRFGRGFRVLDD